MTIQQIAGIVAIHSGEILLVKQSNKNHWSIPKGKSKKCELLKDTAKRELYEETGIKLNTIHDRYINFTYTSNKKNIKVVTIFYEYLIIKKDINIKGNEIQEVKFFPINEGLSLLNKKYSKQIKILLNI